MLINMQPKKFYISWKRVLIFVLLFCIIGIIVYVALLYRAIEQNRTEGFTDANQFVLEHSTIEEIERTSYFQANQGYFVMEGNDKDKRSFYIFLGDNQPLTADDLYIVPTTESISAEIIEQTLLKECDGCTLINTTPAMIDQYPLWELTYHDEYNRYVIEYKYLENGKTFEKIKLSKN